VKRNPEGDGAGTNRRRFLKGLGVLGVAGLAGCGGDGSTETPPESATATATATPGVTTAETATATDTATPADDTTRSPTDTATGTLPGTPIPPGDVTPAWTAGEPPADATVLFGEGVEGLSKWQREGGGDPPWTVGDGYFEVVPGSAWIETREPIGDCHVHVEFKPPEEPNEDGERVGNSGVFMMGQYEFQVLNNRIVDGTSNGMAGAYYAQAPPLVDSSRSPDEWQAYDIIWRGPNFEDGEVVDPARTTVFFNGVVTAAHLNVVGTTSGATPGPYAPHPEALPLQLQDHDQVVRFRNIWYRSLGPERDLSTASPTYGSDYQQEAYAPNDGEAEDVGPGETMAHHPSDATLLLGGGDLRGWTGPDGGSPGWTEADGYVVAEPGAGTITSEETVGDCQLHAEFRIPEGDSGENPGESAVLLANRYGFAIRAPGDDVEPTQQAGGYPGQSPPLSDAVRPRGEWQSFDIVWEGPRFGSQNTILSRYARATVLLNGMVVQHRLHPNGMNADGAISPYGPHSTEQPIGLAENGDPVHFRNVWFRPLD